MRMLAGSAHVMDGCQMGGDAKTSWSMNGGGTVRSIVLNWQFTDTKQTFVPNLENGALTHVVDAQAPNADATLTLTHATLDAISLQQTTFPAAMQSGRIKVAGNPAKVGEVLGLLETFLNMLPIVEPRPAR